MTPRHVFISSDNARLKSYSANSRGGKTVLRIELEIDRPYALANLLEQLAELQAEQATAPTKPRATKSAQRLLPPPSEFE